MINDVHIKNFALIDEMNISFYRGLNILTGETGAGKSIIIGAMNALNGERVSADVIKSGADYAFIELSFTSTASVDKLLEKYEISTDDFIYLSRKILSSGRSVYKVNGEKVNSKIAKEFFSALVDIHSQREHSLLLKKDQTKLIDSFMDSDDKLCLDSYLEKYADLKSLEKRIKEDDKNGISPREAELLKFEIDEINALSLIEDEDEILEAEYATLSNGKSIIDGLYSALNILEDDDYGANGAVAKVASTLSGLSQYNDELENISSLSIDAQEILRDLTHSLSSYADAFEIDDERLAEISDRLSEINKLKSKYKATVSEIFEILYEKEEKYDFIMNYEDTRKELAAKKDVLLGELSQLACDLTKIREKISTRLAKEIEKVLADLNLETCQVRIDVAELEGLNERGINEVCINLSTNKNEPFKPIYEVASGGEMSRIMLAIKAVVSKNSDEISMVFDEIDTGISGRTAGKVAMKIDDLAKKNQLICITHLPQIAAFADRHFLIEKAEKDERIISNIRLLKEDEAYKDLARLIGGVSINEAAILAAKDMLLQAREYKKR